MAVSADVQALADQLGVALDGLESPLALLQVVEELRLRGYVIVLKWDGERGESKPYTAVITGPPLGEDFLRRDDQTLAKALTKVLEGLFQRGL